MTAFQGKNLIFLISQPRSGSTLLQLILSSHPDIATTSEPWIALHPVYALRKNGIDTVYNSHLARNALLDFLKQSGVNERFYKRQVAAFLLSFYKESSKYQKKKFFLDKTPRYYFIVSELIELFPEAKFIILFRNPLAVLNSVLKTWVKNDLSRLGDYSNDLMAAPQILVDFVKAYPDRCMKVNYEELVAKPEAVLNEICRFLGISYSNNMLDYSNMLNSEWKFGDSVGIFKASRPTAESLENWKKDFVTPQERLFAMSYLKALGADLVKETGYNYNEIESSIEISAVDLEDNLISWETIMSDIKGFSKIKQIKEMLYPILSDENLWIENMDYLNRDSENSEWRKIITYVTENFKDEKIKSLIAERDKLRVEKDAQIKSLREHKDALLNSLSWKITRPLRVIVEPFKKWGK